MPVPSVFCANMSRSAGRISQSARAGDRRTPAAPLEENIPVLFTWH
jgi:hypothetical protein